MPYWERKNLDRPVRWYARHAAGPYQRTIGRRPEENRSDAYNSGAQRSQCHSRKTAGPNVRGSGLWISEFKMVGKGIELIELRDEIEH